MDGKWNDFADLSSYPYYGYVATQTLHGVAEVAPTQPAPTPVSLPAPALAVAALLAGATARRVPGRP